MASIRLETVSKIFPGGQVALRDLSLDVAHGELLVLVGPSGCGKTTTLRLVAGLEKPNQGMILLDGQEVTTLAPHRRGVAMVLQNFALYPHLTVRQNLAFPLRMRRVPRAEIAPRVEQTAGLLGLEPLLDRRPAQLSGGEQQRVALGRALVQQPRAFLLDEPLSNLDAQLRGQMRTALARLQRRLGTTMLYVTHDQEEAMTLGHRVAVLRAGVLQQVAAPLELYLRPVNMFVAGFIGAPPMNFIPGTLARGADGLRVVCPFFQFPFAKDLDSAKWPVEIILGIRPQDIQLTDLGDADTIAHIELVQVLGSTQALGVSVSATGQSQILTVVTAADRSVQPGAKVGLAFPRGQLHYFDARTGARYMGLEERKR
jgi:ABC-type sugar transport system ATPase subunit